MSSGHLPLFPELSHTENLTKVAVSLLAAIYIQCSTDLLAQSKYLKPGHLSNGGSTSVNMMHAI